MLNKKNIINPIYILSDVRFFLTAVILILCAVVLTPAINNLSKNYGKKSAFIRKPLKDFDVSKLPSFKKDDWEFQKLDAPTKDMQTEEYIFLMFKTRHAKTPSVAQLLVTYYNDPADKVGHTPDVCGRQAGYIVTETSTITIDMPQLAPDYDKIKANVLILSKEPYYLVDIFVFFAENKFRCTRQQVRWTLAMPGNYYTYFSKIETGAVYKDPWDKDKAIQTAVLLLQETLSELLANHFPTIQQITKP
jgi:hypothetical protein